MKSLIHSMFLTRGLIKYYFLFWCLTVCVIYSNTIWQRPNIHRQWPISRKLVTSFFVLFYITSLVLLKCCLNVLVARNWLSFGMSPLIVVVKLVRWICIDLEFRAIVTEIHWNLTCISVETHFIWMQSIAAWSFFVNYSWEKNVVLVWQVNCY